MSCSASIRLCALLLLWLVMPFRLWSQQYHLWTLAAQGNEEGIRAELSSGANVDQQDRYGNTPLMWAARMSRVSTVRFLLSAGADVNVRNDDSATAIHAVFDHFRAKPTEQRWDIVRSRRDSINAVIVLLTEYGADINAGDKGGYTALHAAAENGLLSVTDYLLQHGASVGVRDRHGITPLMLSLRFGIPEPDVRSGMVRRLIEAGADVNAFDDRGSTPLMYASGWNGSASNVRLLIEHGAHVNATDRHGMTPLMMAQDTDVVSVLLAAGADVHSRSRGGLNALYYITSDRHLGAMRLLIQSGAEVNVTGVLGETPLCRALESGQNRAAALLRSAGARECAYRPGDNPRYRVTPTPDPDALHGIYIPADLDDCFAELKRMLHPDRVAAIRLWHEEDMIEFHMGLGMYLRNNWGLLSGSRLQEYFLALGVCNPDDMTGIIFDSFWRHLNGLSIELDEQIEYYQHWEKQTVK